MADEGLKILLNAFWGGGGWKDGSVEPLDFAKARNAGYMFKYPETKSHSETLDELRNVVEDISAQDVADAFLFSLSSHRLEYRSALGSYWYARAIPKHETTHESRCDVCGWYKWRERPSVYDINHGLNVFNFERYKWGGVRHCHLDYALFDLQQFLLLPKVTATERDKELLREILQCVEELEAWNKAGKYRECLMKRKIIRGTKAEFGTLLDILGICGILSSEAYPSYDVQFADMFSRNPVEYSNDYAYPLNRWKAEDGINWEAFEKVFGCSV